MKQRELGRRQLRRLPLDEREALLDRLREQLPEQRVIERTAGPVDPEGPTVPIVITFEGLPKIR
jgi:hypothetical protein